MTWPMAFPEQPCFRCGLPVDWENAVVVEEIGPFKPIEHVVHADRDICEENLR